MTSAKNSLEKSLATESDPTRQLRICIYWILITLAVGSMTGRIFAVNSTDTELVERYRIRKQLSSDLKRWQEKEGLSKEEALAKVPLRQTELQKKLRLQRPFLSSNDRSRWMAIRSLVEYGTFEIDKILEEPTWDSVDIVQHRGHDGKPHMYSSKPPLLYTMLAAEYWVLHKITGKTLKDSPYLLGRFMVFTINVLPMLVMFWALIQLVERFGTTDWGRIFVMAVATLGTLLTTFAVVLNNHTVGAVSAAITLYAMMREDTPQQRYAWLAGFAAAFTAANELPALAMVVILGAALLWRFPALALKAYLPAVLLVVVAFFTTNYAAHNSLRPPYMHRSKTIAEDNWYDYSYTVNGRQRDSYWRHRSGIDTGEPSKLTYAWHTTLGHHGIISLTPVWILSLFGMIFWLKNKDPNRRDLALLVSSLTLICLVFYIGLRPQEDRNYGGWTCGFRWMFWFAPLWVVTMLPAVDRISRSPWLRRFALLLLALSVLSVTYPTWNPWRHPWIYYAQDFFSSTPPL